MTKPLILLLLMYAPNLRSMAELKNAIIIGDEAQVTILLTQDFNINARGTNAGKDDPPLCIAARHGQRHIINLLLSNGAQIDITDEHQEAPLHEAVRNNHFSIVQLLTKQKAPLEQRNIWHQTPLLLALDCDEPSYNIIEWLLEHNANVNAQDEDGNTAAHLAFAHNRMDLVQLLEEFEADMTITNIDDETPPELQPREPTPPPPAPRIEQTIEYASFDDAFGYWFMPIKTEVSPWQTLITFYCQKNEYTKVDEDEPAQDESEASGESSESLDKLLADLEWLMTNN